jgi:hypothetical protein
MALCLIIWSRLCKIETSTIFEMTVGTVTIGVAAAATGAFKNPALAGAVVLSTGVIVELSTGVTVELSTGATVELSIGITVELSTGITVELSMVV